jgi:hypothetical protein
MRQCRIPCRVKIQQRRIDTIRRQDGFGAVYSDRIRLKYSFVDEQLQCFHASANTLAVNFSIANIHSRMSSFVVILWPMPERHHFLFGPTPIGTTASRRNIGRFPD